MKRLEIDIRHQGVQVRRYGPRQYDVTIKVLGYPGSKGRYNDSVFERIFKSLFIEYNDKQTHFASWYLKKFERIDDDTVHIVVQQDYLD